MQTWSAIPPALNDAPAAAQHAPLWPAADLLTDACVRSGNMQVLHLTQKTYANNEKLVWGVMI